MDIFVIKVMMFFVEDNFNCVYVLMGDDFWSYGVSGNVYVFNKFLDYYVS